MFLAVRDPFDNYMRKLCFENCEEENHDKVIVYLSLSRKIGEILFSGVISMILLKWSYACAISFMLLVVILYLVIIYKISIANRVKSCS